MLFGSSISAAVHAGAARIDAAKARSLLADAAAHAHANGHPRLWRAVADAALGAGEVKAAERAYVQCSNYNVSCAHQDQPKCVSCSVMQAPSFAESVLWA